MNKISLTYIFLSVSFGTQAQLVELDINWAEYIKQHDLLWNKLPQHWHDAPFIGNGEMGSMIYKVGPRSIRWDVNNSRVEDHRKDDGGGPMLSRPRLPIGYFTLETKGEIVSAGIRQDLWNAEIKGTFETMSGTITFRSFIHATENIMITEIEASEGEADVLWKWHPLEAASPRVTYAGKDTNWWPKITFPYQPNPPYRLEKKGAIQTCIQPLLAGGQTATAWKETKTNNKYTLYVTVDHTYPDSTATQRAIATVERLTQQALASLVKTHRAWWNNFYPKSFIAIPDPKWESFYWIQLYKFACATRSDKPVIGTLGTWLQRTPWPGIWWNLNVQLTYWMVYGANHLELGESLLNSIGNNLDNLIKNVPEAYRYNSAGIFRASSSDLDSKLFNLKAPNDTRKMELGNLLWALHNYWLHYKYSMDQQVLANLYPVLKRAVNLYMHYLKKDDKGIYHLPPTVSPEYGIAANCTYDLALLRWGCKTLLKASTLLKKKDELRREWEDILENLVEYYKDDKGLLMIGKEVPFDRGHRHFSHLLMYFPLFLEDPEDPEVAADLIKNVNHWQDLGNFTGGYTKAGASSMMAAMGKGDAALYYFENLTNLVTRNTFYQEGGPVIETPFFYAHCLQNMLLQSWGEKIRVFPYMTDCGAYAIGEVEVKKAL